MMNQEQAIVEYQCPGCVNGPAGPTCPKYNPTRDGCSNHIAGTIMFPHGPIFLGMPKGFNRIGTSSQKSLDVYETMEMIPPNFRTIYSVPVWLWIDERGNTLTRWFSPRTNTGWIAVILGDHGNDPLFKNTIRVTQADMDYMN